MEKGGVQVVVAGHICLDIIPTFEGRGGKPEELFAPGKLVNVGPAVISTGGAVSNAGIALRRLGFGVRLMGKVGDDPLGRVILDHLASYGSSLGDGMILSVGEKSSYSVVLSPPGVDRIFLHYPGTNDTFSSDDLLYDRLSGAKLLHFGYPPLMRRMYQDGGKELEILLKRVKEKNLSTSLDMAKPDPESDAGKVAWPQILERVLPQTDFFLPSLDEILFMLDRKRYQRIEQQAGASNLARAVDGKLLDKIASGLIGLGAAVVVIKLGDQGLYLRTTKNAKRLARMGGAAPKNLNAWVNRELLSPCFKASLVGTTGSGDCAIAGFLAGVLSDLPPEETMTGAVAVGACSVEVADATSGIPEWRMVWERVKAGWERLPLQMRLEGWTWDEEKAVWRGPGEK